MNTKLEKTDTIHLPLEEVSRNWEGIVGLKDGLLLVTDKFPETKLIYIKK